MLRQTQTQIDVETRGQRLYEITDRISAVVSASEMSVGQITIFCRHTSASLTIQENADPDVQLDLAEFYARLVPEGMSWLRHTCEGPDDMPAHIKAALTDVSLTVPIADGSMRLGTWQGIYLFEHRTRPHRRYVVLQMIGA